MPCATFPTVTVDGGRLVLANGQPFFAAGMVYSSTALLGSYGDGAAFDQVLQDGVRSGATTLRSNAFLKGLDLRFGPDGLVQRLGDPHLAALRQAADRALQHGLLLQIVLSTAHFLRCGWGGCDATLRHVRNIDRVERNLRMIGTESGVTAYLNNVLSPLLQALGPHPAVLGFLIVNEGYGMVRAEDNLFTYLSDRTLSLQQLRRFVNRVAGRIRRTLPGALLSASLKIKTCAQHEAEGNLGGCGRRVPPAAWYEDRALIAAGGDALGTLDVHQWQFYPKNAFGSSTDPFLHPRADLLSELGVAPKPTLVGEFPIEGLEAQPEKGMPAATLLDAYDALWQGGYSGGFTWRVSAYEGGDRAPVNAAYRHVRHDLLKGMALVTASCPPPPTPPPCWNTVSFSTAEQARVAADPCVDDGGTDFCHKSRAAEWCAKRGTFFIACQRTCGACDVQRPNPPCLHLPTHPPLSPFPSPAPMAPPPEPPEPPPAAEQLQTLSRLQQLAGQLMGQMHSHAVASPPPWPARPPTPTLRPQNSLEDLVSRVLPEGDDSGNQEPSGNHGRSGRLLSIRAVAGAIAVAGALLAWRYCGTCSPAGGSPRHARGRVTCRRKERRAGERLQRVSTLEESDGDAREWYLAGARPAASEGEGGPSGGTHGLEFAATAREAGPTPAPAPSPPRRSRRAGQRSGRRA